jgi:hypothetical protein
LKLVEYFTEEAGKFSKSEREAFQIK